MNQKIKAISADFLLEGGGSIFILRPVSAEAKDWVSEHIGKDNGFQP